MWPLIWFLGYQWRILFTPIKFNDSKCDIWNGNYISFESCLNDASAYLLWSIKASRVNSADASTPQTLQPLPYEYQLIDSSRSNNALGLNSQDLQLCGEIVQSKLVKRRQDWIGSNQYIVNNVHLAHPRNVVNVSANKLPNDIISYTHPMNFHR